MYILCETLKKNLASYNLDVVFEDSTLYIKADYLLINSLIIFLKSHVLCRFNTLYDISIYVNNASYGKNKYTIYYYLFSVKYNIRVIVVSQIFSEKVFLKTLVPIFPNAAWFEREIWDMFGIFFKKNKDLRRLLTDYGFKFNPLLKEYPLKGYVELKYDTNTSILKYTKVSDQQQPKIYDFKDPWKFFF